MDDDRARASDRLHRIRDRHFDCYVDLARAAQESGADEPEWIEVLDSELANLRSALEWGLTTGRYEAAAFATSLLPYWRERRRFAEGRQILDRALLHAGLPPNERIEALLAAGALASDDGDREAACQRYEAARQLAASVGDVPRRARAASGLGWACCFLLRSGPAAEAFSEALELSHGLTLAEHADALRGLAWVRTREADYADAIQLHRDARELLERANDPALTSHYLVETNYLAGIGKLDEARALADKSLELARRGKGQILHALESSARVASALGDRAALRRILEEGEEAARAAGSAMWEANFQGRLADDAMAHDEVDMAREWIARALRVLDGLEALNIQDVGVRARLLLKRAAIAEDDDALDLAEELHRQAVLAHSGWNVLDQGICLTFLADFLVRHGDKSGGRLAATQAVALIQPVDRLTGLGTLANLAIFDGDLEGAFAFTGESLEAVAPNRDFPSLHRRRAALLAELGRLEETAAALDEALRSEKERADSAGRAQSHVYRARLRIAAGDSEGARSDLQESSRAARAGADGVLLLVTTFARLALLEGRSSRADELWSAVEAYRTANTRVAPRLSLRFEAPLRELRPKAEPRPMDSRSALNRLRSLVAEEFDTLTVRPEGPTDGSGPSP